MLTGLADVESMREALPRTGWIAFLAVAGGSACAAAVGAIAVPSPTVVALCWFLGASAAALWGWYDDASTDEFAFTADGARMLCWLSVFLLPPLGAVLGVALWSRDEGEGRTMLVASVVALTAYAAIAAA